MIADYSAEIKIVIFQYVWKQQHDEWEKELKCLVLNERSIINNIDDFHAIIYDIQPDIVGITETWANADILVAGLCLQGYHLSLIHISEPTRPY